MRRIRPLLNYRTDRRRGQGQFALSGRNNLSVHRSGGLSSPATHPVAEIRPESGCPPAWPLLQSPHNPVSVLSRVAVAACSRTGVDYTNLPHHSEQIAEGLGPAKPQQPGLLAETAGANSHPVRPGEIRSRATPRLF